MSEAERDNVAECNPIGIDFNQDNVPACLITVSQRQKMGKDHLLNVLEACLEQNCSTWASLVLKVISESLFLQLFYPRKTHIIKNL